MTGIYLPVVGSSESGSITEWYFEDGEVVECDEIVAVVDLDKVSVEITSPARGLLRVLVAEGVEVSAGTEIGRLEMIAPEDEIA